MQHIKAGENPATWMLEVTGGAAVTGKSKAAKVDFAEYYKVSVVAPRVLTERMGSLLLLLHCLSQCPGCRCRRQVLLSMLQGIPAPAFSDVRDHGGMIVN